MSALEKSLIIKGVHQLGGMPAVYSGLRRVMGHDCYRRNFVERALGEYRFGRILDLGCGTGQMAAYVSDAEQYVGIDENAQYIKHATRQELLNATFREGDITNLDQRTLGQFDCVIMMGVIHHLSDTQVHGVLRGISKILEKGGILATTDCVRRPENHWSANLMINHDRGNYVRDGLGYTALVGMHFNTVRGQEMLDGLKVPVTRAVYPQYMTVSSNPHY